VPPPKSIFLDAFIYAIFDYIIRIAEFTEASAEFMLISPNRIYQSGGGVLAPGILYSLGQPFCSILLVEVDLPRSHFYQ